MFHSLCSATLAIYFHCATCWPLNYWRGASYETATWYGHPLLCQGNSSTASMRCIGKAGVTPLCCVS